MSGRIIKGEGHRIFGKTLSWAGLCPWTGNLCFGDESGGIHIPMPGPRGGRPSSVAHAILPARSFQPCTDAVNGIAFAGDLIGCTSRMEVVVARRCGVRPYEHEFSGGAHGIVSSTSSGFLAPIGFDGVLLLQPVDEERLSTTAVCRSDHELNCYRMVRLGVGSVGETFACAARKGGVLSFASEGGMIVSNGFQHVFNGYDIIDVCSIGVPEMPSAIACLSRNGGIFLISDALGLNRPLALKYDAISGTPYTILSSHGHLFVLTNKEFVCLPDVAGKFLRGETLSLKQPARATAMPISAADAFGLGETILLLDEEGVTEYVIADLVGNTLSTRPPVRGGTVSNAKTWDVSVPLTEFDIAGRWTSDSAAMETSAA